MRTAWACDNREAARRLVDLTTVAVLLDAGAGDTWVFTEEGTGFCVGRSEGLGIASLHMFQSGGFSSDVCSPHRADSVGLKGMKDDAVSAAFQASEANPLVGCEGRAQVLKRLGSSLEEHPSYFERGGIFRPGNLVDYMFSKADGDGCVSIKVLWEVIMYGYASLWPAGRTVVEGCSMGDTWRHQALPDDGSGWSQLIPFHKLSQWMTYSLMEPLQEAGITLTGTAIMTGLPEYRNGGLLVDMGVLEPKHEKVLGKAHHPHDEVIVEWRALTVCLLDEVYAKLKEKLRLTEAEFPLVKCLEAGTWKAGRVVARLRDPVYGAPPIQILSDGTVF
ncbi:unnamed protein product [Chrysoparadoxa australica]